jgi:hypothetical protein
MIPELTPLPQIEGISGVLMTSVIAFIVVFFLLAGLCLYAIISLNRHVAVIVGKNESAQNTVPSEAIPAPVFVSAPVNQIADPGSKDMKKIVAAISAAINASVGRSVRIISVTGAQAPNISPIWRVTGITECMESRLSSDSGLRSGSRSW